MAAENEPGPAAVTMETRDPAEVIAWQAEHSRKNSAPVTGRVVEAMLPLMRGETAVGRRIAGWQGKGLEDAMPLRLAGGLHWLSLTGRDDRLRPVYAGEVAEQAAVDAIVAAVVAEHDAELLPWFDGPPQTNEAGRSGGLMGGFLWLAQRLGPRFQLLEIGASAGCNTMIERYAYDLGGTKVGPADSPVLIRPEWRGAPPPAVPLEIVDIAGCDRNPIDLTDPEQALRLKAYVWPETTARLERLDAIIGLAMQKPPRIARADAADWVERQLDQPQAAGVTRALYHSIVWQYLPVDGRARIEAAMLAAGARATAERPLAWVMLETNRQTFCHELRVRHWPGDGEWHLLGEAHAHGAWVEWLGVS